MQKFPLGQIVATPGALAALAESGANPLDYLQLHASGDWGEIDAEDWKANNRALENDERLLSMYTLLTGQRIWIITEWDRSVTTFLLPEEY